MDSKMGHTSGLVTASWAIAPSEVHATRASSQALDLSLQACVCFLAYCTTIEKTCLPSCECCEVRDQVQDIAHNTIWQVYFALM